MLKNLTLKALSRIALAAGNITGRKKRIDTGIKSILVNRTDRLGDAAVSLPFLFELQKNFKLKILTSRYNDPLLKGIFDTEIATDEPSSLSLKYRKLSENTKALGRYDLYLDLVGISSAGLSIKIREMGLCRYYAGFNLGIWNGMLDHFQSGNPVLFSKKHVLESYRSLLKSSCGIDIDIPDSVNLDKYLVEPADFKAERPYILVNIAGADRFRGPTAEGYAQLINSLEFKGNIVIMDEEGRPNFTEAKKFLRKENLCFLERNHTLWELAYIAKNSLLYIGSDSGITQLLAWLINSLIFFASGSPIAWRPYSRNEYSSEKTGDTTIETTITSSGLTKKIVYVKQWCRPCFDIGCSGKSCIRRLDTVNISKEINLLL